MQGLGAGTGSRRRRTAAVAVSLALHGLVLGWLGLDIARLRLASGAVEPPALELSLAREAPQAQGASGSAGPTTRTARPEATVAPVARAHPAAAGRPAEASLAPAEAAPSAGGLATASAPLGGHPGAGDGGEAAGVRGALRGLLGCAHAGALDLTAAERARCAERIGLAARTAPKVDPIPAEKRKYYDAVAQAYAETHFYGTPSPWAGTRPGGAFNTPFDDWREGVPPGHTANIGCSPLVLLPGYKPRPHSLKLGPCVITPPRGTFTEEADIPDPPTLREREADAAHMRRLDPPKP